MKKIGYYYRLFYYLVYRLFDKTKWPDNSVFCHFWLLNSIIVILTILVIQDIFQIKVGDIGKKNSLVVVLIVVANLVFGYWLLFNRNYHNKILEEFDHLQTKKLIKEKIIIVLIHFLFLCLFVLIGWLMYWLRIENSINRF